MAIGAPDIEGLGQIAERIDSRPADVETMDRYEERIEYYDSNDYTYIPMPRDGQYYNVSEDETGQIKAGQYVRENLDLFVVLEELQSHPFLLVDYSGLHQYVIEEDKVVGRIRRGGDHWSDVSNDWIPSSDNDIGDFTQPPADSPEDISEDKKYRTFELEEEYPDLLDKLSYFDYDERYGIITLADVNRRPVKERIYPVFAELANQLSNKIEEEYPDPREILDPLRAETIGYWYQAKWEELNLHIAEYMSLVEMKEVIKRSSDDFVTECGFDSKNQVQQELGAIEKSRNRVMHANRTLVHDRDDLETLINRVQRAQNIINRIAGPPEERRE